MRGGPYISTLSETGPLQSLPRHILDRLKRSARDPQYFNAVTFGALADQYLEECYYDFVKKSEGKELHEVHDCWEKQYYLLKREYEDFLSTYDPSKWKPSRIKSFLSRREEIFKPEMERIKETIREYVCWRQWRQRYPALLEKAQQGDSEAKTKLDLVFTKKGHASLCILGELDRQKIKLEGLTWWILEHRDDIGKYSLPQVIDQYTESGIKFRKKDSPGSFSYVTCPGNDEDMTLEECQEKFKRKLFYKCSTCEPRKARLDDEINFRNREKVRKLFAEMGIHTREGKRGRPRNH